MICKWYTRITDAESIAGSVVWIMEIGSCRQTSWALIHNGVRDYFVGTYKGLILEFEEVKNW